MSAATGGEDGFTVRVDRERCVGTGLCAAAAPGELALGPDGRSRPLREVSADSAVLVEAAEMCPVEAITVHLSRTGERIAPLD